MANFKYRAKDKSGKSVSGIMSADDKDAVAKHLRNSGYAPISIETAAEGKGWLNGLSDMFARVKLDEIALFTRQLLTLQQAGVTLLSSLTTLEKQTSNVYLKDVIRDVSASVEEGTSLSTALESHPKVFSELYVNMVRAGEASGTLEEMLKRLAEFEEKEIDTQAKIKGATRYPLIVLVALFGAFLIMVNVVVPKFEGVYGSMHAELPLPTKALLGLSWLMRHYWFLFLAAAGAAVYSFLRYIKTKNGRLAWDSFKLSVPIFGQLNTMIAMSRFARSLSVLLKSGLPVIHVLDMVSRTVNNSRLSKAIDSLAVSVKEGKGISAPMSAAGDIFPPMVVQMVAIGEETGKVDELLMKVSEYYDQQSKYLMENLSAMIEPVFVLGLGAMVLSMALAIFLPMWSMISIFKH